MKQNNFKVAITGGICSGKSTVCKIIKESGYPVFSCDEIYAELLQSSNFCKQISDGLGGGYFNDGELDKDKLKMEVFSDGEKLQTLNSLTHPAIMQKLLQSADKKSAAFCEVPLLFENGYERLFDGVIVVLREKSKRIAALVNRDKISEKDALLRINSQFNYDKFDFAEYYVIHNDKNLADLKQKTQQILQKIQIVKCKKI